MTLTHCPRCDYSLEGLPEVHPCPECGLVCDRGATVFVGWPLFSPAFVVPVIALYSFMFIGSFAAENIGAARVFMRLLQVAIAIGALGFARYHYARRRRPPMLAAFPEGILFNRGYCETHLVPWREVSSISLGTSRAFPVVRLRTGPFELPAGSVLNEPHKSRRFVEEANAQLLRYLQQRDARSAEGEDA